MQGNFVEPHNDYWYLMEAVSDIQPCVIVDLADKSFLRFEKLKELRKRKLC